MGRKKKSITFVMNADDNQNKENLDESHISPIMSAPINRSDPKWTEFVLSKLEKHELVNGRPTCDGLRRIFPIVLGDIISIESDVIQPPIASNFHRATVKVTIKYYPFHIINNNIVYSQNLYICSDAADVFGGNTPEPFSNHPVATASTMAESRCLRKALRLVKVNSAEEMAAATSDGATSATMQEMNILINPISDIQIRVINNASEKLGIDVKKLLQSMQIEKNLSDISYNEAQSAIQLLSAYKVGPDNGGKIIPENIFK